MSEYIQWFVEEILNQKYIESESLKLWKMKKNTNVIENEFKVHYENIKQHKTLEKQITIYDII
ncbi:hypothetical protein MN108_11565 [Staphylococcus epidermidis]|jgi:hypothetical protein|uniref:hypothetical protein n=1 Tax=Staphylococcus TaxID=1279 RepID=UPI0008A2917C|nr:MULTISPECIES: hypothetical protein [Staphylococcus]HAR3661602.1 hypothetical protein [Staphylococcus aureus]MBM5952833.1 hypothetical protein [Staphylococcus epidermidis]MCH9559597.1 hypothetical protein [Staphylococcus epidermidis]MCH9587697.1 hypothetical protein [Staphylococcus epidermidis]OFQ97003.1 hypothetical protein HMPREF2910_06490 [Staphylococcus sp. HMSC066C03]